MDTQFKNELKEKCKKLRILDRSAKFQYYADNMFTYSIGFMYEFTFISDDILFQSMKVKDLINLLNVEYFEFKELTKINRKQ
jgi:hypothetical protein